MSLTATLLRGLPINYPTNISRRVTHYMDEAATRAGHWSPEDWSRTREENTTAVRAAVAKGINYPAAIANDVGICHVTVAGCLKALVASGEVEKYSFGLGKRQFYRMKQSAQ